MTLQNLVADSLCEVSACEQLCLPTLDGGTRCHCTDGFVLNDDELTCEPNCTSDEISCGSLDRK